MNDGPGIGTGLFIGAVVVIVGGLLVHSLARQPPIDITGTATGPCALMPVDGHVGAATVYLDGELLATGHVGRWAPTLNGALCTAAVNVTDVGTPANFYDLHIGPMVARVSADNRRFRMETG